MHNSSCEKSMCISIVQARTKTGVAGLASGAFQLNFHTKWLLWNVHVYFDCAGPRKTRHLIQNLAKRTSWIGLSKSLCKVKPSLGTWGRIPGVDLGTPNEHMCTIYILAEGIVDAQHWLAPTHFSHVSAPHMMWVVQPFGLPQHLPHRTLAMRTTIRWYYAHRIGDCGSWKHLYKVG